MFLILFPFPQSDSCGTALDASSVRCLEEDVETLVLGVVDVVVETILSEPQHSHTYVSCPFDLSRFLGRAHVGQTNEGSIFLYVLKVVPVS